MLWSLGQLDKVMTIKSIVIAWYWDAFLFGTFLDIIPHQTFISQGYFKYFKPYCDILGYWYSLHADMVCIHNNIVIFWDTFWDITWYSSHLGCRLSLASCHCSQTHAGLHLWKCESENVKVKVFSCHCSQTHAGLHLWSSLSVPQYIDWWKPFLLNFQWLKKIGQLPVSWKISILWSSFSSG